ncbi:NAD(+) diphosphatase [Gulosibacter molinativorax]|uniref:NAD(+) diphosphatase n=1 Tax=Gulosibacter molinativorax TaxID=256821 RepID=A0ABT7C5Y8_9MICO|nr:NAD(+) diphosphatase [Gulosibacter molinativorax]MDJ1370584.1 NAD(+) diphosphatase [Gulosibacter molinativorax]QUY62000.1 NADH pyrophosphatase [Gulosibacter molinativorax]
MNDFVQRLPFALSGIDRDDLGRKSADGLLENPGTRILVQRRDTALVAPRGGGLALDLRENKNLPSYRDPIYLGKLVEPRENPDGRVDETGTPIVAVAIEDFEASQLEPEADRWPMLNESGLQLDRTDASLYAEALAIRNFHRNHQHSPLTGERLAMEHGGWVVRPEDGGQPVFPRVDPAIIIGVVDKDDRILLGANVNWKPKRYSTFAGFVEPGESFEQAATREVMEEAGARIVNHRYLGSQPWPFPASVMIGFLGELDPEQDPATVRPDNEEIAEVRWFTREEIRENIDLLPPRISISRAIIEEWYGGPLD